ncbi:hypothetical protein [Streptomyces corynorhini]|uniref:hypothetical protein n=1 Tax=Streptomyces corynorhini TaxID=2282652 RepID=UPI001F268E83|nr:hypothetical protein [Streptomyces corynorhini]
MSRLLRRRAAVKALSAAPARHVLLAAKGRRSYGDKKGYGSEETCAVGRAAA